MPAGPFTLGAGEEEAWAYDSERSPHEVFLGAFRIDRGLVTNAEFAAFVEAGGYRERQVWSEEGSTWREAEALGAPLFWRREGDRFIRCRFDTVEPVPLEQPVQHVSWYEADAYARWCWVKKLDRPGEVTG